MMPATNVRFVVVALVCALAGPPVVEAAPAFIVNDSWSDGTRIDPAAPAYSENGTDTDGDHSLESAWYEGGASTMTASTGHLNMDLTGLSSSANWTTYFTAEGDEVNLANDGDMLRVTWQFTLTGVGASNGSQNFRLALVDSPPANRLAVDGSPPGATAGSPYAGYAIFANMGVTSLGNSTPFQLRERVAQGGESNIVGTTGNWSAASLTGTVNGATTGNGGFENAVPYALVWKLTRNGGGIDVRATLSGGTVYNNTGSATIDANDANGNGFRFDTFNIRPSSEVTTASVFDTTLFRVEIGTEITLLGDFDDDGDVDVMDYLTLASNLHTNVSALTTAQSYVLGDMTRDLRIDGYDYRGFRFAYDDANGVGAFVAMVAAIPEPPAGAIAAVGGVALLSRRRRGPV